MSICHNKAKLLGSSVIKAGETLGLSRGDIAEIIGLDPSDIPDEGIDRESESGRSAAMLILLYRDLFSILGGDDAAITHWMHTENRHLKGIPAVKIRTRDGLEAVRQYTAFFSRAV